MRRLFLLLALAMIFVVEAVSAVPGPPTGQKAVMIVADDDSPRARQLEIQFRHRLKAMQDQGAFNHVGWLYPGFLTYDFAVKEDRAFCLEHGLTRNDAPWVCLVTVDCRGNALDVDLQHKRTISNVNSAVAALSGWLAPTALGPPTAVVAVANGETVNAIDGSVLVRVPGGTFTMGSSDGCDEESPPHAVAVKPYWIGKVPVTNAQYRRFLAETHPARVGGDQEPWERPASEWGADAPVVGVSWHDAVAYCKWAGLRLPTEAEWEFAARGPQSLTYPWGNFWDPVHYRPDVLGAVGRDTSNASPFGCLDMEGSVRQWCSSKFEAYPYDANDGREAADGNDARVQRGSSYTSVPIDYRCASRSEDHKGRDPGDTDHQVGFRVAKSAP